MARAEVDRAHLAFAKCLADSFAEVHPGNPRQLPVEEEKEHEEDRNACHEPAHAGLRAGYLVEKYLADAEVKQRLAYQKLAKQLPDILALMKMVSQPAN